MRLSETTVFEALSELFCSEISNGMIVEKDVILIELANGQKAVIRVKKAV